MADTNKITLLKYDTAESTYLKKADLTKYGEGLSLTSSTNTLSVDWSKVASKSNVDSMQSTLGSLNTQVGVNKSDIQTLKGKVTALTTTVEENIVPLLHIEPNGDNYLGSDGFSFSDSTPLDSGTYSYVIAIVGEQAVTEGIEGFSKFVMTMYKETSTTYVGYSPTILANGKDPYKIKFTATVGQKKLAIETEFDTPTVFVDGLDATSSIATRAVFTSDTLLQTMATSVNDIVTLVEGAQYSTSYDNTATICRMHLTKYERELGGAANYAIYSGTVTGDDGILFLTLYLKCRNDSTLSNSLKIAKLSFH